MIWSRYITRWNGTQLPAACQCFRASLLQYSSKHEGEDTDSDDERAKVAVRDNGKQDKSTEAVKKLNMLLQSMLEEEKTPITSTIDAQLSRPPVKQKAKKEDISGVEKLEAAAKNVAESLGGDVKQTESELLSKLRLYSTEKTKTEDKPSANLSELLSGMKIDRSKKSEEVSEESRAQQVRRILAGQQREVEGDDKSFSRELLKEPKYKQKIYAPKVDLFGGESLGIFKLVKSSALSKDIHLSTWEQLEVREKRLAITHPPANIFEEMIQWTEQGKLWHFPINNEQGLEKEGMESFTEHIFLERHLEPWCPRKGPVRHFMELVCVGLSKNPHITAQHKREHIEWFRNYFEQKRHILEETGALPPEIPPSKQVTAT